VTRPDAALTVPGGEEAEEAVVNRPVRRVSLVALLVALVPVLLLAARPAPTATATAAVAAPVRIMPLGDSITGSPGCWRALLWNRLQSNGFTNIDFVGTLPPQGCGVPYDGDNEGHGGILASGIVSQNLLPGWLAATNPNIVLMHLGTNDVWNGQSPTAILASYTTLVGQMRAANPNMTVLVAQIIPMNPSNCTTCAQGVVNLDAAIPAWAASLSTAQSPVVVVDQWTGFNDATDTGDGVHPNDSGNQKMSDRWYPPLAAALGGTPVTTTAPPTTTPTTTAVPTTTTGPASGGCVAAYTITNQWSGGFQASVTVTNSGTSAVNSWRVSFTLGAGQTVTQSWNTALTQTGSAVTAANLSYNGSLAPGAGTSFGFLGATPGTATAPAVTCGAN
jgi:lysophospholipase L1-like esterase